MAQISHLSLLMGLLHITGVSAIIGGKEVVPNSIPYMASIQFKRRHLCGGTLINDRWVVSAAHCWPVSRPHPELRVVLAEHDISPRKKTEQEKETEQEFNVSRVIVHDEFNYSTIGHSNFNYSVFENDILLMQLERPAEFNAYVYIAELPNAYSPPLTNRRCTVSGWGVTRMYRPYLSPVLRSVEVDIFTCHFYYNYRTTDNMICAGSRYGGNDSCVGDSGGPLICDGRFEGIVSWGIGCAIAYFPGVYTKVRNYIQWINDEIVDPEVK